MADAAPETGILMAILASIITAIIGFFTGRKDNMTITQCNERRTFCTSLNQSKLELIHKDILHLRDAVDELKEGKE